MLHGLGLLDDPKHHRGDGEVGAFWGLDGPESSFELKRYARYDLDQGATNSCVWFYLAQSLWILSRKVAHERGVPNEPGLLLSPLAGYYATRKFTARGGAIVDVGCRPSDATTILQTMGWCPWSAWPFVASKVDKEPDFDVFIASTSRRWFFDLRVLATESDERCRILRSTIGDLQQPVGIGLTIDLPFQQWKESDGPWKRKQTALGRHMVTAIAYEPAGVWIVGSYGSDNGKNNTVLLDWSVIGSPETEPITTPMIDEEGMPR